MLSRVRRQRENLATIDSTGAVQTKGFGFSFQATRNSTIAYSSSGTLPSRLKENTLYPAAVGLGDVLSHPIGAEHVSCDLNDGVIGLRPRIVVVPRQSL